MPPLRRLIGRVRPLLPDVRDVHVYGGGLLVAAGVAHVWAPGALVFGGALLLYLGLRLPR